MQHEESHNYLSLRRWRGFWFFSMAQTVGFFGGLLLGGVWGVSRQPGIVLFFAVPLALASIGVAIGTESGGVIMVQHWWHHLAYVLRRVLHVDTVPLCDGAEVETDLPVFYCEERIGEQVQWSYYRPGAVEEGG